MLENHMHAIWNLPLHDSDYSKRLGATKKHYTQSWLTLGGSEKFLTASRVCHRRRGIWQPRFLRQAEFIGFVTRSS
jgi:putative transposase